jgi:hypothetical protein
MIEQPKNKQIQSKVNQENNVSSHVLTALSVIYKMHVRIRFYNMKIYSSCLFIDFTENSKETKMQECHEKQTASV